MKGVIHIAILTVLLSASAAKGEKLTIIAAGDIMPAERVLPFIKKHGFDYPYEKTREILQSGDIVIGNLETPITKTGTKHENKQYTFKAPVESASALKKAGFTHLSLANNHMMDYGPEGLASTLDALNEAGIKHSGAGKNLSEARKVALTEIRGTRIAFLAYSNTFPTDFYATQEKEGTAPGYRKFLARDIKMAKERADIVIVSFHWGAEKMETPKDYQKELARLSIDSGASVILGHHPHVLQGIEHYREGIIFYSLGNFVFGSYSRTATESIIARIVLDDGNITAVEALPINVNNTEVHFRPEPLAGEIALKAIERLSELSAPLGSQIVYEGETGSITRTRQIAMQESGQKQTTPQ